MSRCRFSLCSLFIATTVLAAIIMLAAHYPLVGYFCLLLVLPLLVGSFARYIADRAPILARSIMVLLGTFILVAGIYGGHLANRNGRLDRWPPWLAVVEFAALGLMCYYVAWTVATKQRRTVNQSEDSPTK